MYRIQTFVVLEMGIDHNFSLVTSIFNNYFNNYLSESIFWKNLFLKVSLLFFFLKSRQIERKCRHFKYTCHLFNTEVVKMNSFLYLLYKESCSRKYHNYSLLQLLICILKNVFHLISCLQFVVM